MVCFCCLLAPLLLVQKIETSRLDGTYKEMIEVIEPPISATHSKKTTFLCGPCDQAAMQCMLFLFLHGPTQQVDGVCVWKKL